MAGIIKLKRSQWNKIRTQLNEEYPRSYLLIREVMKRELGFTPRDHRYYDELHDKFVDEVHLDFFNDAQESFFRLKYLDT